MTNSEDQDAAGTNGAVAARIERLLGTARPDVMQRVARDDGIIGRVSIRARLAPCERVIVFPPP
jgi:hypothetical protein